MTTGRSELERYEHRTSEDPDVQEIHASIQREKESPRDGFEPVPLWLLLSCFSLLLWGGWYLGKYDADFSIARLEGPAAYVPVDARRSPAPAPATVDPMAVGRRVYGVCAACHQRNGLGVAGQFPTLRGTEWVNGDTGRLVRIVLHGLQGPVRVKGEIYNGAMPGWAHLSDLEIASVLTYVRGSFGNRADPIAPERVAEVRAETAGRTKAWSAGELGSVK